MKSILFIFFTAITLSVYSQDTINNFRLLNGEFYWQKVFITQLNFTDLLKEIKSRGILTDPQISDSSIMGDLRPIEADFKGAGYTSLSIPQYIKSNNISGFAKIEYRVGRYRVTVNKIVLTEKSTNWLSEKDVKTTLEYWGLKGNGKIIAPMFKKHPAITYNHTFEKLFSLLPIGEVEKW